MYYALVILAIIICFLLVLIVLIQNPKGGGLSSGFAGSNSIMGVQRTGDFLEKGTWVLTISLMLLALLIHATIPTGGALHEENNIQKQINVPSPLNNTSPILPGAKTRDSSTKK